MCHARIFSITVYAKHMVGSKHYTGGLVLCGVTTGKYSGMMNEQNMY